MNKNIEEMNKEITKNNEKTEEIKKKTEVMKKTIKQQNEQIESIINNITVNDVKNNPAVKQWVLDVAATYNKYGNTISLHLAELINATKQ